ncbi:MAG: polysaccharide biosynthesis/export family protein [Bryobacteraceae bacterium]
MLGQGKKSPDAQTQPGPQVESIHPAKPGAPGTASTVGAPVDPNTYLMGPQDVVFVRVWREPDFSEPVAIRPDGKITLPLVGDLQAAGLTPVQLGAAVAKSLSKYVNTPDVSIIVQQVNSKKYYVTGGVMKTGAYPLVVPTTVLEAISQAGGFQEFANTKKVKVLRGSKQFHFNYKEVVNGKNLQQNIYLENGDYVIVPN